MKPILTAMFVLLAAPALAQTAAQEMEALDTDGDGVLSFFELEMGYPDLDAATFDRIDLNGDGLIDPSEFEAAREQDVLGTPGETEAALR
ncbi:EF-hand domain-containing protein [Halodurantibacterium flavum]|uniref:EF-hand domain-containing protein n=1 Tax=Halodurantibacterium flavum TaxID=1382802 RepID=A0ABW4S9G6_9RHOB